VGPLQVVAHDPLIFGGAVPSDALQPIGESTMKLGPSGLRNGVIDGVPDQRVLESEGFLTGEVRSRTADEVLANEGQQVCLKGVRSGLR